MLIILTIGWKHSGGCKFQSCTQWKWRLYISILHTTNQHHSKWGCPEAKKHAPWKKKVLGAGFGLCVCVDHKPSSSDSGLFYLKDNTKSPLFISVIHIVQLLIREKFLVQITDAKLMLIIFTGLQLHSRKIIHTHNFSCIVRGIFLRHGSNITLFIESIMCPKGLVRIV